jgi:hypothetical protein
MGSGRPRDDLGHELAQVVVGFVDHLLTGGAIARPQQLVDAIARPQQFVDGEELILAAELASSGAPGLDDGFVGRRDDAKMLAHAADCQQALYLGRARSQGEVLAAAAAALSRPENDSQAGGVDEPQLLQIEDEQRRRLGLDALERGPQMRSAGHVQFALQVNHHPVPPRLVLGIDLELVSYPHPPILAVLHAHRKRRQTPAAHIGPCAAR